MHNDDLVRRWPHWMETLLRTWCLLSLIGWQGGFAFYSGVVVPVGAEVLGSELEQGWVTRSVTPWLNGIGWIGVLASLLALRLTCWGPSPSGSQRWSKKLATSLVLFLAVSLLALQLLHGQVDLQLDQERRQVVDYDTFYDIHRVYLILSTAQWLAAIALTVVLVHGWTRGAISEPRVASPSSEALS